MDTNDPTWPFSIFGGTTGTARAVASPPTTVQYWVDSNSIPQKRWPAVIAAAKLKGVTITADELMNMRPAAPNEANGRPSDNTDEKLIA